MKLEELEELYKEEYGKEIFSDISQVYEQIPKLISLAKAVEELYSIKESGTHQDFYEWESAYKNIKKKYEELIG